MSDRYTFTSESVTEGHPDKMCDQISDAVLDAILEQDPESRVACESMATTGVVIVAGEISTNAHVDYARVVRDTVCGIGYSDSAFGFDGKTCSVITSIDRQSPDIAMGVDKAAEQRAGTGDALRRDRRRRSGDDVRVRVQRHQGPDADADLARASPGASGWPRSARTARSTTCARTARRRSRSSTRTGARSGCPRSSSRPRPRPGSTSSTSCTPSCSGRSSHR